MTDIIRELKEAMYYCLFIDGASDNITVEQELHAVHGNFDTKGNVQFYFVR